MWMGLTTADWIAMAVMAALFLFVGVSGVFGPKPAPSAPVPKRRPEEPAAKPAAEIPKLDFEENEEVDPTKVGPSIAKMPAHVPTKRIVYDEDAETDEPTQSTAMFLLTATAQTDKGLRRKRNEDSLLAMKDASVYVVADGMGGYMGGEIASSLAVKTMEEAFTSGVFKGPKHESIPARASELARAIQMANEAILARAGEDKQLEGMGTTMCAARFSANKERLYVGHVGDSRMYRLRGGELRQMTSDHTMKDLGVEGAGAAHLSRAVGVWPQVPVDILLAKPEPGDTYLLCSDGLTKMVSDEAIADVLKSDAAPSGIVDKLIEVANERGGKDNITVIVIRVESLKKNGA
ncbi:MAG TPA: PP2C family serine/threonine-protein phosphatase [Labilithrix sp.]|jgi:protein phosphatase